MTILTGDLAQITVPRLASPMNSRSMLHGAAIQFIRDSRTRVAPYDNPRYKQCDVMQSQQMFDDEAELNQVPGRQKERRTQNLVVAETNTEWKVGD